MLRRPHAAPGEVMRRAGILLLGLLIGGAFYLLLIDTSSLPELYVLAGAALLAAVVFDVSREEGLTEATVSPQMLLRAWRAVARIPLQILIVSWEAIVQLATRSRTRGAFRAIRFSPASEEPREVGRRALVQAFGSLAPNTIVIGVDPERDLLLVHQLRPSEGRRDLDVVGSR